MFILKPLDLRLWENIILEAKKVLGGLSTSQTELKIVSLQHILLQSF